MKTMILNLFTFAFVGVATLLQRGEVEAQPVVFACSAALFMLCVVGFAICLGDFVAEARYRLAHRRLRLLAKALRELWLENDGSSFHQ